MKQIAGNSVLVKQINTNLVRNTLKQLRTATKQAIAQHTSLTTVTIGTILQELLPTGEIHEGDLIPSQGGRPSRLYHYNPDFGSVATVFAYEVNGHDTFYTKVVNLFGETIYAEEQTIDHALIFDLYVMLDKVFAQFSKIQAIGFGLPGVVYDGKLISDYSDLNGNGFLETFHQKYQVPIVFENDVNAACLGYCKRESIAPETPLLYVYFPQKYCPGTAIHIDGSIYKGYRNFAGEIRSNYFDVPWTDEQLYTDPERFCADIARFLVRIASILSPEKIVLYGSFLTEETLNQITDRFNEIFDPVACPEILLTESFHQDYEIGMISATLQSTEPTIALLK